MLRVIDTHTEGEPTRVVIDGGPELGGGSLAERRLRFVERYDRYRSAVVNEPRGSDVHVGALLVEPLDLSCAAGVIFFNNVGCLSMCGHGLMGVVAALAHLGRIEAGPHRFETPAGSVDTLLHGDGRIDVVNVPSFRHRRGVSVDTKAHGSVVGDVAWGGNWFFLVSDHGQDLTPGRVDALTDYCWEIRESLGNAGITGEHGAEIDHVELFGPPLRADAHSRNFVLCPGKAYDRSPCGTGTSAKLACLHADGELAEGEVYRQESIVGSLFESTVVVEEGRIVPTITGTAFVNGEATLLLNPEDPFCWGMGR